MLLELRYRFYVFSLLLSITRGKEYLIDKEKKRKKKHVSRSGHIANFSDNITITFLLLRISLPSLPISHFPPFSSLSLSLSPTFTQTFSTFSQSTEAIEFIVLTFLLSVSVSLLAMLDVDTPM